LGERIYCLRALADGNYIQIKEKMLEFSSVVLPASSSYCRLRQ